MNTADMIEDVFKSSKVNALAKEDLKFKVTSKKAKEVTTVTLITDSKEFLRNMSKLEETTLITKDELILEFTFKKQMTFDLKGNGKYFKFTC